MENKRTINAATLFIILKGRKPFFILGVVFTSLAVVLTILFLSIGIFGKAQYEKYDVQAIEKNGVETTGIITGIETLYNTSINNEHPKIISYEYNLNGQSFTDKEKTLISSSNIPLELKNKIKIKTFNNQSIIEGIKSFQFPFYIFLFIPFAFSLAGIPFLLLGLFPALKRLKLYKYGNVKDAIITSMAASIPRGKNKYAPTVLVDYYFIGITGQKITGHSYSHDMSLLLNKKQGDKIKILVLEDDEWKNCIVDAEGIF